MPVLGSRSWHGILDIRGKYFLRGLQRSEITRGSFLFRRIPMQICDHRTTGERRLARRADIFAEKANDLIDCLLWPLSLQDECEFIHSATDLILTYCRES
jgi:hypothetical protein